MVKSGSTVGRSGEGAGAHGWLGPGRTRLALGGRSRSRCSSIWDPPCGICQVHLVQGPRRPAPHPGDMRHAAHRIRCAGLLEEQRLMPVRDDAAPTRPTATWHHSSTKRWRRSPSWWTGGKRTTRNGRCAARSSASSAPAESRPTRWNPLPPALLIWRRCASIDDRHRDLRDRLGWDRAFLHHPTQRKVNPEGVTPERVGERHPCRRPYQRRFTFLMRV